MDIKQRMHANLHYKAWLDGLSEERAECKLSLIHISCADNASQTARAEFKITVETVVYFFVLALYIGLLYTSIFEQHCAYLVTCEQNVVVTVGNCDTYTVAVGVGSKQ